MSLLLSNPSKKHWEAIKWILMYLKGTPNVCLCYRGANPSLESYTDVDIVGDPNGKKLTSGYLYTFAKGVVS